MHPSAAGDGAKLARAANVLSRLRRRAKRRPCPHCGKRLGATDGQLRTIVQAALMDLQADEKANGRA